MNIHSYRAEAIDHLTRLHGAIDYNPRLNLLFAADGEAFEIRLTPGGYLVDRVMPKATKALYTNKLTKDCIMAHLTVSALLRRLKTEAWAFSQITTTFDTAPRYYDSVVNGEAVTLDVTHSFGEAVKVATAGPIQLTYTIAWAQDEGGKLEEGEDSWLIEGVMLVDDDGVEVDINAAFWEHEYEIPAAFYTVNYEFIDPKTSHSSLQEVHELIAQSGWSELFDADPAVAEDAAVWMYAHDKTVDEAAAKWGLIDQD